MKDNLTFFEIQRSLANSDEWMRLPTPKMRSRFIDGVHGKTHAYAGFSFEFAVEAIRMLKAFGASQILDPFVGSGTSALAAAKEGVEFYGVDADPFSALITRAKLAINADKKKS